MALNKMSQVFARLRNLHRSARCNIVYLQKNYFSFTQVLEKGMTKEPITFSKTEASKLKRSDIFYPKTNPAVLPVERFIIVGSLMVFMIYFCILREENKIDEILAGTYNYEGDEELKLVNAILQAKLKKLNTDDLEEKLRKIRGQK